MTKNVFTEWVNRYSTSTVESSFVHMLPLWCPVDDWSPSLTRWPGLVTVTGCRPALATHRSRALTGANTGHASLRRRQPWRVPSSPGPGVGNTVIIKLTVSLRPSPLTLSPYNRAATATTQQPPAYIIYAQHITISNLLALVYFHRSR